MVHITSDPIIEVDGDEATQTCALLNIYRAADKSANEFVATGRYFDRLVRTPEGWRIKERRVVLDLDVVPFWEGVRLWDREQWRKVAQQGLVAS